MADTALPDLTAGAASSAADLFYTTQSGNSRKVTGAQLQALTGGHPGYVSGRWYSTHEGTLANGLNSGGSIIQLGSFYLPRPVTISDLGCRVATLGVGNCQLAIYAGSATSLPTGNPVASTGNISTAAGAAVSADITGADVTLAPGLYWGAVNYDNATALITSVANAYIRNGYLVGSTTLASVTTSTVSSGPALTIAQTFGTWPDLTGGSFTETSNNVGPILFMKAV